MAVTPTTICNNALVMLGRNIITDIDEDTSIEARVCRVIYPQALSTVLNAGWWRWATKRKALAKDPTYEPEPQRDNYDYYEFRYELPSDFVQLQRVEDSRDYKMESGYILSNYDDYITIRYLWDNEQVHTWSKLCQRALIMRVRADLAYNLTENASQQQLSESLFLDAYNTAYYADSAQVPADTVGVYDNRLINVRYGTGFGTSVGT